MMDNDDELAPDALYEAAKLLQENRDADVIYSDSDKLTESGERVILILNRITVRIPCCPIITFPILGFIARHWSIRQEDSGPA